MLFHCSPPTHSGQWSSCSIYLQVQRTSIHTGFLNSPPKCPVIVIKIVGDVSTSIQRPICSNQIVSFICFFFFPSFFRGGRMSIIFSHEKWLFQKELFKMRNLFYWLLIKCICFSAPMHACMQLLTINNSGQIHRDVTHRFHHSAWQHLTSVNPKIWEEVERNKLSVFTQDKQWILPFVIHLCWSFISCVFWLFEVDSPKTARISYIRHWGCFVCVQFSLWLNSALTIDLSCYLPRFCLFNISPLLSPRLWKYPTWRGIK